MIKIENLYKSFGQKEILKGVNLDIVPNKTSVVFGFSGGGKSTIIKHVVGLLKPTSGNIFVNGHNIATVDRKKLNEIRKDIGFLFQSGALFDSMNVEDNISFPLKEHTKMTKKEMLYRVEELLSMVDLDPKTTKTLYPDELSGGMKKRVGLARSIALKPNIILYDEPTSGLDPITANTITLLIKRLQEELNTTSILISHDIKESFIAGDYFALLHEGKILEYSDKHSFQNSPNETIQKFIAR
jgi:phospholipid/cholesterol/gamma-HCH transport system ATP-binding protein